MLDRLIGGIAGGITGGIGGLVGGVRDGYYCKDNYGYGFEEHRAFESHVQTQGGYSDRHARYKHQKRLPANHARRPMAHHMLPDSNVEEFYESRQSHHSTAHALPYHSNNHHATALPYHSNNHHNGKMSNGWHEDAYHDGYGMQQQNRLMAPSPQVPTRHVYMNPTHEGHHKYKDRDY